MSIAERMMNVDRRILYMILAVVVSGALFIPVNIPATPDDSSAGVYVGLSEIPQDKVLLIQSDWTLSTRGENLGHFEALLRVVMGQNRKFVLYSLADPQAPQVARDALRVLNAERKDRGLEPYILGQDYLDLGFFPNAENTAQAMGSNLRNLWANRKTKSPNGEIDIWQSPVLQGVSKIEDIGALVVVTASNTIDIAIQRLSDKVTIICMCTGVTGPTVLPYFSTGQLKGLAIGLKGVYDMELLMTYGMNDTSSGENKITNPKYGVAPKLENSNTYGRGRQYYGALHGALALIILAIVLGNVAMLTAKKAEAA
jgi:hypothetical protein